MLRAGEAAIAKLGPRAAEVQALITSTFAQKSLAEVQDSFEKTVSNACNAEVLKVGALVREQAAAAIEDFKAAELWLHLKTPEVADGNNFGVEVQAFVLGELKAPRPRPVPIRLSTP